MRFPRALSLFASLGLAACGGGGVDLFGGGGGSTAAQTFLQLAVAGNIVGDHTLISHPDLDGNPAAMLLVTPVHNHGDAASGVLVDSAIGVEYLPGSLQWSIYREDGAPMEDDSAFAVTILPDIGTNFVHRSTAANVSDNSTFLDHPATNGNQPALLFVTHAFAAGGVGGMRDTKPLGVWFNTVAGRWAIFHQDRSAMEVGQAFFVAVLPTTERSFVHTADGGGAPGGHLTVMTHVNLDGRPGALLHATANFNPTGGAGTYNPSPIGVLYHYFSGKWAVFNEFIAVDIDVGDDFNVWVP